MPVKLTAQIAAKCCLLYFLVTIGVIGLLLAYGIATPLHLIGRFWRPAEKAADRVVCSGIYLLMSLQPWLSADIDIQFPRNRAEGCLLVSNHRSHLDSFLLLSRVPGIRIMAKHSLFFIPFLGLMMRVTKQIPAKRGHLDSFWNAMAVIRERLRDGETVHVFPEMTRCQPGLAGTASFSTAPFLMAFQAKAPVIPIVFKGTDDVWPKGFWGLRAGHPVSVRALPPIDPRDFSSATALRDETRRRIDEALL